MLSIIVPAFNEQDRISESVHEIILAVNELELDYEILLVDDGSADFTWQKMLQIEKSNSRVRLIKNLTNLGIGASYRNGLEAARGEYVTWVPADLSHKKESLIDAYSALGIADMIIPLPKNPQVRSLKRRLISKIFTLLVNFASGYNVPYYNGLSVHKRYLLQGIKINSTGFGYNAEIIIKLLKKGATYRVVDTYIEERRDGKSKALTLSSFSEVAKTIAKIFSN